MSPAGRFWLCFSSQQSLRPNLWCFAALWSTCAPQPCSLPLATARMLVGAWGVVLMRQGVFTTWIARKGHAPFPLPRLVASGGLWCSIVGGVFSGDRTCVTRAVSSGDFSSVSSSGLGVFSILFFWLVLYRFAL
jgi:hypothetical protein